MALKKEGLAEKLQREHEAEVKKIEKLIDDKLARDYTGRPISVTLETYPHEKVRQELTRRYKEAGWTIEFKDDQRDGPFITLQ
ncbi:MAG: hypothetical protein WCX17_02970 [Parcubacteria group bacterium]|jgi:hypothetical protein